MSEIVQYDSSIQKIGGFNVTEATQSMDRLVFNESYIVIGSKLRASSIYASYDLTVIGDVEADEIEIGGNLNISGSIKAKRINCNNAIFCDGDIDAESVSGTEIVANNITCNKLYSTANIISRMTVDIKESIESEKSIVSGEGIVGNGLFSAYNAIAVDYFEFDGDVKGKVIEMATDDVFGEPHVEPNLTTQQVSFDELIELLNEKIMDGLDEAGKVDEEELLNFIKNISDRDTVRYHDWEDVVNRLVELSYSDSITNLADYLNVIFAKKILPKSVIEYETIEHVFKKMLPKAETRISELDYRAKDVNELARSLIIGELCHDDIKLEKMELFDRIFQSIGIKLKTVMDYIG